MSVKVKKTPRMNVQGIAKVMGHPDRVQALTILCASKEPLSAWQLAQRMHKTKELAKRALPGLSYHLAILRRYGAVQEVGTARRRGATEHFLRPTDGIAPLLDGMRALATKR